MPENSATFSKDELTKFQPSFPITKSPDGTHDLRQSVESNSSIENILKKKSGLISLNTSNSNNKVKESYRSPNFGLPTVSEQMTEKTMSNPFEFSKMEESLEVPKAGLQE